MNITPATIKSALFQVISNAENNIHDFIKIYLLHPGSVSADICQVQVIDFSQGNGIDDQRKDHADDRRQETGQHTGGSDVAPVSGFHNHDFELRQGCADSAADDETQGDQNDIVLADKGFCFLQRIAVDSHHRQLSCLPVDVHIHLIQQNQYGQNCGEDKTDDDDQIDAFKGEQVFAVVLQ